MIKDRLGQTMFGTNTFHTEQILEDVAAGSIVNFTARFDMNLGPGSYSIATALVSSDTHLINNYEWRDLALLFTVQQPGQAAISSERPGPAPHQDRALMPFISYAQNLEDVVLYRALRDVKHGFLCRCRSQQSR